MGARDAVCLVGHDQQRLAVHLHLLDERVEALNDVQVALSARVPVPQLVQ